MRLILTIFILSYCISASYGQYDLENLSEQYKNLKNYTLPKPLVNYKDIKLTGGLNASTAYRPLIGNDQNPLDYQINTQVVLSYKKIAIPFNYSYTNGKSIVSLNGPNYKLPSFENFGITPTYKWAKVHIGHSAMSFSKYTYDGLRFKGIGTELNPGKAQLKFFYGNLFKKSITDYAFKTNFEDPFKRKTIGISLGYETQLDHIHAIVLKADDRIFDLIQSPENIPEENTVLSLKIKKSIIDSLNIESEFSYSGYTPNGSEKYEEIATGNTTYNMLGLFIKRPSSIYGSAYHVFLNYPYNGNQVSLKYENISKNYNSLGTFTLLNNIERLTIENLYTVKEKIKTNLEIGFRKAPYTIGTAESKLEFIGKLRANYPINDKVNLTLNLSNMQNRQRLYHQSLHSIAVDSISMNLVKFNSNVSFQYILDEEKNTSFNANLFYIKNTSTENQQLLINQSINHSLGATLNFQTTLKEKNIVQASYSHIRTINSTNSTTILNPSLSYTHAINDKMNYMSLLAYNVSLAESNSSSGIINNNTAQYKITKTTSANASIQILITTTEFAYQIKDLQFLIDFSQQF